VNAPHREFVIVQPRTDQRQYYLLALYSLPFSLQYFHSTPHHFATNPRYISCLTRLNYTPSVSAYGSLVAKGSTCRSRTRVLLDLAREVRWAIIRSVLVHPLCRIYLIKPRRKTTRAWRTRATMNSKTRTQTKTITSSRYISTLLAGENPHVGMALLTLNRTVTLTKRVVKVKTVVQHTISRTISRTTILSRTHDLVQHINSTASHLLMARMDKTQPTAVYNLVPEVLEVLSPTHTRTTLVMGRWPTTIRRDTPPVSHSRLDSHNSRTTRHIMPGSLMRL
jgi:hypothetical protein